MAHKQCYCSQGPHSVYLLAMYRYPEGITASKLCEVSGKDKSDVSRMMAIMEKNGLVRKEGIHQNLYRGVFKLTDEGRMAAEFVYKRATLAVEIAGAELTEEKRTVFYEALERIADNLQKISQEGLPEE